MRSVFVLGFGLMVVFGYQTASASIWSIFNRRSDTSFITTSANSQKIALLEANLPIDPELARGGGDITIEGGNALVPEVGPLGSGAEVTQVIPQNGEISTYVVKNGDSLSKIAETFGVSVNTIIWANNISKGTAIKNGDVLIILPVSGVRYTVKKGDTLAKIAANYKSDVLEISQYNGLYNDSDLTLGREILIPNGELHIETAKPKPAPGSSSGKTDSEGKSPSTASKYASLPAYGSYYIRPISGGTKTQGIHGYNGVDLAHKLGVSVVASASGKVIIARSDGWNGGYGNYVVISHSNGTQTLYGHLLDVNVSAGQDVGQGEVIGHLGSSGRSTGPHVHFEIRGAKNPF